MSSTLPLSVMCPTMTSLVLLFNIFLTLAEEEVLLCWMTPFAAIISAMIIG